MSEVGTGTGERLAPRLADAVAALRRAMRRAARASAPDNPLSVAQLELLACLAEHPGARPSELARLLRLAPNTVATLVTGLVGLGMTDRGGDPADRRTVRLRLTAAGTGALATWQRTNEQILDRARDRLPADQQAALRAALPALAQLVAEIDALAGGPGTNPPGTTPSAGRTRRS